MNQEIKSLQEINSKAIRLLSKELGIANTIRFINQYHTGLGNYTEDRVERDKDLTLDEIVSDINKNK